MMMDIGEELWKLGSETANDLEREGTHIITYVPVLCLPTAYPSSIYKHSKDSKHKNIRTHRNLEESCAGKCHIFII